MQVSLAKVVTLVEEGNEGRFGIKRRVELSLLWEKHADVKQGFGSNKDYLNHVYSGTKGLLWKKK